MAPSTTATTTNSSTPINSQQQQQQLANTTTTTSAKKSNETTLTHLTKRFVKLLNTSSERVINLNDASTRLNVAKRRIYDITNVLEGIGLLQKTSKNVTKWVDCPCDSRFAALPQTVNGTNNNSNNTTTATTATTTTTTTNSNPVTNGLPDAELLALLKTYQSLEDGVNDLEARVRQQLTAEEAYVTYHDVKSFFNDQIVIAVKAPSETRLEVNENLQIWMKSENGEIEVYLCPQQSQLSNSTQPLDTTITNIIGQQSYTPVSSDEGRGRSTTDGQYYDQTSGVSVSNDDPTLSSALTTNISEDEDPFRPLVPLEETHYNYMLDDNYSVTSLFPDDDLLF